MKRLLLTGLSIALFIGCCSTQPTRPVMAQQPAKAEKKAPTLEDKMREMTNDQLSIEVYRRVVRVSDRNAQIEKAQEQNRSDMAVAKKLQDELQRRASEKIEKKGE